MDNDVSVSQRSDSLAMLSITHMDNMNVEHRHACTIMRNGSGAGYVLTAEQWLPRPLSEVFEFFSDAHNLQKLTPGNLNFQVISDSPIEMRVGTLIDYRLRLRGLPLRWRSLISVWEPPYRFVDEQVQGPYRHWHHEHMFEPEAEGTICRDRVHYTVPGGGLIHRWLVQPDLQRIFQFRRAALQQQFG